MRAPGFLAAQQLDGILANLKDVSQAVIARAYEFAETADQNAEVQGQPTTVAAASIYLAGLVENEKVTQAEVADAAGGAERAICETWPLVADANGIPHGREKPYRYQQRDREETTETSRPVTRTLLDRLRGGRS